MDMTTTVDILERYRANKSIQYIVVCVPKMSLRLYTTSVI